jgi:hypothetical protein
MRGVSLVRTAAVLAALLGAGFISLPSLSSVGLFGSPMSVNRALKGDRLPLVAHQALPHDQPSAEPAQSQNREKPPVGCDGAFSPVASPRLANVFKRCLV